MMRMREMRANKPEKKKVRDSLSIPYPGLKPFPPPPPAERMRMATIGRYQSANFRHAR